jgi:hypothetical protein
MFKALLLAAFLAFAGSAGPATARDAQQVAPADSRPPQPSEPWFILATKIGECRSLHVMFDVDTPEAVMKLFADVGHPLEIAGDKGDYVLLKLAGDPNDPGMALVRGARPCNDFLKIMQALVK